MRVLNRFLCVFLNVNDAKSWPDVIVVARVDVRGERRTWCVGCRPLPPSRHTQAYLSETRATIKAN